MGRTDAQRKRDMYGDQTVVLELPDGTEHEVVLCPMCFTTLSARHLSAGACRCGRFWTVEDAPPHQQRKALELPGQFRRCLTCNDCNNVVAGSGYEQRFDVGRRQIEALKQSKVLNSPKEFDDYVASLKQDVAARYPGAEIRNLRVRKVDPPGIDHHIDERKLELKSAYCIAFAALGYAFIVDEALDVVRRILTTAETGPAFESCATELSNLLKPRSLYLFDLPEPMVAVTHPSFHHASADGQHLVWLPAPTNPDPHTFYERVAEGFSPTSRAYASYPWPESGSLPMALDRARFGREMARLGAVPDEEST